MHAHYIYIYTYRGGGSTCFEMWVAHLGIQPVPMKESPNSFPVRVILRIEQKNSFK